MNKEELVDQVEGKVKESEFWTTVEIRLMSIYSVLDGLRVRRLAVIQEE